MPLFETLILAWESLAANRLRAALTMLGMIIGSAAVVLLVSIGTGAKNYITREFEGAGTNLILVQPGKMEAKSGLGPPPGSSKNRLTLGDVESLEKQATSLSATTGLMLGQGSLKHEARSREAKIMGTNEKLPQIIHVRLAMGRFHSREEEEFSRKVVVLGNHVARDLFPQGESIGRMVKLNGSEHRVLGVLAKSGEASGFEMDDLVIVPTRVAMRAFNEDKLFGIRAKAKSKSGLGESVAEISAILKSRHGNQEDFSVITQDSMVETLNTIMNMLTYALAGIALVSMLVGGIGIMNIMLVSVTERTREIGIRRAVGARRKDILIQFLVEAAALAFIGGLVGILTSVAITQVITSIKPAFDMRAPIWIVVPAFLLSILTGLGFGFWPAKKAAGIAEMEALRFE